MLSPFLFLAAVYAHTVHKHSIEHATSTQWKRTMCGTPGSGADIITAWGQTVDPDKPVLPEYPRPQMTRDPNSTYLNLNGLWEFQLAGPTDPVPFGQTLNQTILVPFPLEACLSGAFAWPSYSKWMFYRVMFDNPFSSSTQSTLLHFGAVDWNSTVYLNGVRLGTHVGGFDGFFYDLSAGGNLKATSNELIVQVYDPSDSGYQPNGKQRISAITNPGGDTYTPSSGIWQTVWLEAVPVGYYITNLKIRADMEALYLTVETFPPTAGLAFVNVTFGGQPVTTGQGDTFSEFSLAIPNPHLWSALTPSLYDFTVTFRTPAASGYIDVDTVGSYFGMRKVGTMTNGNVTRPTLNDQPLFLAAWLDQSWWPDGEYTAPTTAALTSDVQAVLDFGLNSIRLHQKVNPDLWYAYADRAGVYIMQDMIQKYGGASGDTCNPFMQDLKAMMDGRGNHPSIIQYELFNEDDCWKVFDVPSVYAWAAAYDPYRLIDGNSGPDGRDPLSNRVGNVSDGHSYPWPRAPTYIPGQTQMIGEFGGVGAFIDGKEWTPGRCHTYLKAADPATEGGIYINMTLMLKDLKAAGVSASVYTQITDVELECDGFLNFDRTNKFDSTMTSQIKAANAALIAA